MLVLNDNVEGFTPIWSTPLFGPATVEGSVPGRNHLLAQPSNPDSTLESPRKLRPDDSGDQSYVFRPNKGMDQMGVNPSIKQYLGLVKCPWSEDEVTPYTLSPGTKCVTNFAFARLKLG